MWKHFPVALASLLASLPSVAVAAAPTGAILPSVLTVDTKAHTAVLPVYRGTAHGQAVWYIVTDASDVATARRLHVIFSPALATIGDEATQTATRAGGRLDFAGAPDFAPTRTYVASAGGFPPTSATPGGLADAAYSPFVRVAGEPGVLNAPIVATGDGPFDVTHHANTEDRVLAIDTTRMTVTLTLARGFVNGKPMYYISTEASDPVAAAVERSTYVPRLAKAHASATIPIGVVANGPTAPASAQGLRYLALDTPLDRDATLANAPEISAPFNVLSQVPDVARPDDANAYSPLWTAYVVARPQTARLTSYAALAGQQPSAAGFVVNCPVIAFGDDSDY
ncbi:MAG TPA: hypothetical protein VMD91_04770 [Candidatus Sulfotelmatobacter sp.]|nr:hypothetical protein [Candidatus Sulfotelmatobacter sp.]